MRKVLFILFTLASIASFGQGRFFHQINSSLRSHVTSNIKDVRFIDQDTGYAAFGFIDTTRDNRATYYYRKGTDHLTGGLPYYREYNIVADHWYDPVVIDSGSGKDSRDVWGGTMDNDSTVLFLCWSNNGVGGDYSTDLQIIKGDSNNHFGTPVNFNWGSIPRYQRAILFGHIAKGVSSGEYYQLLFQFNVDTGTANFVRIDLIHTTDYFNTYTNTLIAQGTLGFTEGAVNYLGDGKMNALFRVQNGGTLYEYESTNSGATWTAKAGTNLGWYIAGGEMIPFSRMENGKLQIIYQDRDNEYITISRNNDTASFFNRGPITYNGPELFSYNLSENYAVANSSLGYPSYVPILIVGSDTIRLVCWAHETNTKRANIKYTRTDFKTDPAGIPVAPPNIDSSSISTPSFRVDIFGYTQVQLDNIRYFQFDLSTDPAFGSFVTAKYRSPSVYPTASLLQNIKMFGLWDVYNSLTTATTYYLRIRACNNAGCSDYTTINVTTN